MYMSVYKSGFPFCLLDMPTCSGDIISCVDMSCVWVCVCVCLGEDAGGRGVSSWWSHLPEMTFCRLGCLKLRALNFTYHPWEIFSPKCLNGDFLHWHHCVILVKSLTYKLRIGVRVPKLTYFKDRLTMITIFFATNKYQRHASLLIILCNSVKKKQKKKQLAKPILFLSIMNCH